MVARDCLSSARAPQYMNNLKPCYYFFYTNTDFFCETKFVNWTQKVFGLELCLYSTVQFTWVQYVCFWAGEAILLPLQLTFGFSINQILKNTSLKSS